MKANYSFYIRVIFTGLIFLSFFPVMSQESNMYIPLGGYDYIGLDSQAIHSPGAGSIFIGDNYTFFGTYRYNSFSENAPEGYPENFHSINVMVEAHNDRHQVVTNFISDSDQPVAGGWASFRFSAIYTYQLVKNEELKVYLGLGAALGDFGIDMENGKTWPLLPIPYLGIEYNGSIIKGGFRFVSGPSLNFTLFPENRFRISSELEMDKFRDMRDLIFNVALHFRFFSQDDSVGDMAGISVGIRNNSLDFTPGGSDESYEIQYYSLFTELDLSFLKITGGYAFEGRERLGDSLTIESGDGFFLNLQALYQF